MGPAPPTGYKARMQRDLLNWYHREARSMPWRDNPGPYRTWLSEIMLQQTRVATAVGYFETFVERWPTVESLAAADLDEVLGAWSGLGYYSRARNLHRTARQVVAQGGFPASAGELRELPGIGRYTAGAIASIALGQDEAVVDGNVERVLSRIHDLEADPRSSAGGRALWELAERLLVRGEAGTWNQALMELGALICLPRSPRCAACPVQRHCAVAGSPRAGELPRRTPKKAPIPIHGVCLVAQGEEGALLLRQRPDAGLLGGTWGLPGPDPVRQPGEERKRLLTWCQDQGGHIGGLHRVGEIQHVFTHRVLTMSIWAGSWDNPPLAERFSWKLPMLLGETGLSSMDRKCLETWRVSPDYRELH